MNNQSFPKIYIIVVLLVSGGIFAWQYWWPSKDETADWKTYSDGNYGYEVKYPTGWQLRVADWLDPVGRTKSSIELYPPWVDLLDINTKDPVIVMSVVESTGETPLPIALFGEYGKPLKCKDAKIGKFKFCKLIINQPEDSPFADITTYTFAKNSTIYTINISCDLPECENRPEFDVFQQMLSTFGFIKKALAIDWTGIYEYGEFAPGVYGSDQTWAYKLEIYKEDNQLRARLDIDGFQTLTRIQATAEEMDENLDIVFDSYGSENMYEPYEKGELLFSLGKTSDENYKIIWNKLRSNLKDPGVAEFKKTK